MDEKNAIEHLESNKPDKPTQVTRIPYEINTTWWSAVNRGTVMRTLLYRSGGLLPPGVSPWP
jgi:hypothetical protein